MKKQIEEVANYFINRITACEFDSEFERYHDGWYMFNIKIDGYSFCISIHPEIKLCITHTGSFMPIKIPNDRLANLLALVEAHKITAAKERAEKLRAELAEIEATEKLQS